MKKLFNTTTLLLLAATTIVNAQWNLTGNTGTNSSTNFIGTTDNVPFKIRTKNLVRITVTETGRVGIGTAAPAFKLDVNADVSFNGIRVGRGNGNLLSNVAVGSGALYSNTTGGGCTAIGSSALSLNTTGVSNTALGFVALTNNTTGGYNTALGTNSLTHNTSGNNNAAIGMNALDYNTSGSQNSATGFSALFFNTSGNSNSATGMNAVHNNTTGSFNIGMGFNSLFSNTTGNSNVAIGVAALRYNTVGSNLVAIGDSALYNQQVNLSGVYMNTAVGSKALFSNDNGRDNTANGSNSLYFNTNGIANTVSGSKAGFFSTGNYNTFFGANSGMNNATGSDNCFLGEETGLTNQSGFENTLIGNISDVGAANLFHATALGFGAIVNTSNKIRIGSGAVTVIEGTTVYTVSDGRFKTHVVEEVKGLDFINKLRPVVYNFEAKKFDEFLNKNHVANQSERIKGLDYSEAEKIRYSGFIAQEVEQAAKQTGYDFNGVHVPQNSDDNYSLAYGEFTVPLVKAVQELSKQNEALKNDNADLKSQINDMRSCIESLCSSGELKSSAQNSVVTGASKLEQNNPNPFKANTTIGYYISSTSFKAVLKIFSMNGEELKSFVISVKGKGQIEIAANSLAPGVYTYVMIVDDNTVDTKQMVITK